MKLMVVVVMTTRMRVMVVVVVMTTRMTMMMKLMSS